VELTPVAACGKTFGPPNDQILAPPLRVQLCATSGVDRGGGYGRGDLPEGLRTSGEGGAAIHAAAATARMLRRVGSQREEGVLLGVQRMHACKSI